MRRAEEGPHEEVRSDGVHGVLEAALDLGDVPEPLRHYYRARLGEELMWEYAEMLDLLGGVPGLEETGAETARPFPTPSFPAGRCVECEGRKERFVVTAMRRRRILSSALALASLPTAIFALYAFGSPDLGQWWGVLGFAAAGGALFFSWLSEDRRQS